MALDLRAIAHHPFALSRSLHALASRLDCALDHGAIQIARGAVGGDDPRRGETMTKIRVYDSFGTWRGGLFDTDSICSANTDTWQGAANREFDERLHFLSSCSWYLVQILKARSDEEVRECGRVDPNSRAIQLTVDEAAAWFARSHYDAPLELLEASRTVLTLGDGSTPKLGRAEATARSRVGELIATRVLADPTPADVCQAIIDLLVSGGFLELTGECVEISDRRGAIESPDVVASAMLWRTMLTACKEDEVLACLRPLMRDLRSESKARKTVSPQEFRDLASKLEIRRKHILASAFVRDAPAAELVINYVAGRLAEFSVETPLPAAPLPDKICVEPAHATALSPHEFAMGAENVVNYIVGRLAERSVKTPLPAAPRPNQGGVEAAHAKALRLHEFAIAENPSLRTYKEIFAWLCDRDELTDELHGGVEKWTWQTFRRYVSEARRKTDGGRIRPRAEDVRSAVARDE